MTMSAEASPQHHGHIPSYVQHPSANLVSSTSSHPHPHHAHHAHHPDGGGGGGNVFASANSSYSDIQDSGSEAKVSLKGKNGATGPAEGKAKPHVCSTCHRGFTTGGHLQRHQRIHTGIKAYKCPFPGCETRTSRQDNLQQHYRTHLSPTLRRGSGSAARAAVNTAMEAAGLKSTSARIPRKSKASTTGTNTPSSASAAGSTSHLPSPYQTPTSTGPGPYSYPYDGFPYQAPLPSVALAQSTSTNSSRVPSPANGGHVHANPNSVQPMPHQPYFHQPFNANYGYPGSMHQQQQQQQQQYRGYAPPPPTYGMPPHASYMAEHPQQHAYSPMQPGFPAHSRESSYGVMASGGGYAPIPPQPQMQSYPPPSSRVNNNNTTHDDPYRRPQSPPRRRTPDMLSQGMLDPTIMNRPMQMAPAYPYPHQMYGSYQQAPPMKTDNHRNSISSGSDGSGNAASDNSNKQRQ